MTWWDRIMRWWHYLNCDECREIEREQRAERWKS